MAKNKFEINRGTPEWDKYYADDIAKKKAAKDLKAKLDNAGKNSALNDNRLRAASIASAKGIASSKRSLASQLREQSVTGLAAIEKANAEGQNSIRRSTAGAVAAAQASSPRTGFGAALGAVSDASLQSAGAMAKEQAAGALRAEQFKNRSVVSIGAAEADAAAQDLEALKFEREASTPFKDRVVRDNALTAEVDKIIAANKGTFNDDEKEMERRIIALVEFETDPALKAKYLKLAKDIGNKTVDV